MANYRRGRINEEMQKELTMILRRVKDPRVSEAFISITSADCTPDLKYAKIYYSALSGDKKEIAKGLKTAAGFIRRELARGGQTFFLHNRVTTLGRVEKRLKEIFPTGLILSPSHEAILPDINPANVEALFRAVKN